MQRVPFHEASIHTPCFVYDADEFRSNLQDFQRAIRSSWGSLSNVAYSVKTNPLPWLLDEVRSCGCMAEVVSDDEYCLALERGFKPQEIVFNGPVKGRACFEHALKHGALVNIDSEREVSWLKELSEHMSEGTLKVGFRINIALEEYSPAGTTASKKRKGRFGFSYEDGSVQRVLDRLRAMNNVVVHGLHMHVTTLTRTQDVYRILASFAARIIREFDLAAHLRYVDIGGGFFGGGANNVGAYDTYAKTIAAELSGSCDPSSVALLVEPGGAVVATPGYYCGRVVDVKEVRGERFVVSELSRLNIDHELKKTSYPLEVVPASGVAAAPMNHQVLGAFTCMDSDRLCILSDFEELKVGDLLVISYAGAYSQSFTPDFFIWHPPAVYSWDDEDGFVLRRAPFTPEDSLAAFAGC
ncbi:hypothetical protein K6V98_01235 [Collinsella sp. AGMB00827]|uniref:Orn/DAP/Arg decarboxylase 2 N-terminal domain-containing protein n=1 Tax=Collinsella ureilytica TaxID=2869515 RepID=A0ABS7MHZ6_9ACTN|nr:hypothetical protein [Collinsella urealyticum]MBY4796991.1 hypothetical protein [Collinsella urealyticum]